MSIFSTRYHYHYLEPERLSPEEIRQRRLFSELQRQRKALEVEPARLSPANKFHLNKLKEFEDKFGSEIRARTRRREVDAIGERSKSRLFQLLQRRSALQQRAVQERSRNQRQSFVDRSYGLAARRGPQVIVNALGKHLVKGLTKTRLGLIPCIERATRREVMFAQGHAPKGHRVKHHRGPLSHIGC